MAWKSLREWSEDLKDRGDLVVVDEPVSPEYEIAAYVKKSCEEEGPAFRFTNVEGHDMDVHAGFFAAKRRILEALGGETKKEAETNMVEASSDRIEPTLVDDGPVKEVIDTEPNLDEIPIVTHNEKDVGPYITSGVQVANLPHTGTRGQGIYRQLVTGKRELSLWSPEERRVGYAYRVNAEEGEPTEMAIVIGASPSVIFGSIANVGHDIDKYSVAGGLMNESVELVPGETIDVDVPAHAEIVIETLIHGDEKNPEAPFGEYPGVYSEQNENTPRVEVTGIMRREDAIYDTVLTGLPPNEDGMMNWIPRCASVRASAQQAVPNVNQVDVKIGPSGGNGVFQARVAIDKRLDGDPWNVISSVLGGRSQAKYCMVVDDDIDLDEEAEVDWAWETRVQPQRDVYTFPTMTGAPLDPSGPKRQAQKMGIDATIPMDEDSERYEPTRVPGKDDVEW
ncbi:UbiD family decarboxylase [Natrialba swarupiae]|uniref:Anhydromevalonate phosphate decarboxylase n=1 Tax=Natrialba swarupiae TaxID=2448032 RepID=A0A5D5ANQ5_9EURY|nr:UbiD family decarboxylase [Natrialba swarupiae]TYT62643.1 UbiD family decarboxylase [Natrialba swarupiae]